VRLSGTNSRQLPLSSAREVETTDALAALKLDRNASLRGHRRRRSNLIFIAASPFDVREGSALPEGEIQLIFIAASLP